MRYLKIADSSKFATAERRWKEKELKRSNEISIAIKPWICYIQKKQCMYTDFILHFAQDYWIWQLI